MFLMGALLILNVRSLIYLNQIIDNSWIIYIPNVDFLQSTVIIDIKYPIITIMLFIVSLNILYKLNSNIFLIAGWFAIPTFLLYGQHLYRTYIAAMPIQPQNTVEGVIVLVLTWVE